MRRAQFVFILFLAAHFVVSFGNSRFAQAQDVGDCSVWMDFSPWQWNVVSLGNIGTEASPYGADFEGAFAALGNVWLAQFTANANENGPVDFKWSASVGGSFSINGGNIANGGLEAKGDVHITLATIDGDLSTGGDMVIASGNVVGVVHVEGDATYGAGAASDVHEGSTFQMSVDLALVKKYFLGFSADIGALQPTIADFDYASKKITIIAGSGLQIVKIPAATLLDAATIAVTGEADTTLIINVEGEIITFDDLTVQREGDFAAGRLLINFYQATQLALTGQSELSILAPLASVTFNAGYVVGNLVVGNLLGSGQTGEDKIGDSNPFEPPPCPERPPAAPKAPTAPTAPAAPVVPSAAPTSDQEVPPSPGAGQEVPSPPEECPPEFNITVNPWQWNVFVLGDIGTPGTPYSSDFEGAFAALGNVWVGSFTINGEEHGPVDFAFSATVGGSFSIKGGDVENGGIEANGNVRIESASVKGDVRTGGNFQLVSGRVFGGVRAAGTASYLLNSVDGGVVLGASHTLSVDLQSVANYFLSLSSTLGAKPFTAEHTYANFMISVTLVNGVNYLTVDAATLKDASVLSITGPAGATLVINVPDTDVTFDSLDIVQAGGFEKGHIIVNFFNANKIALSGKAEVTILAPKAAITFPGGHIVGNLIAGSLFGNGQSGVSPANGTNAIGGQVGDSIRFSGILPCPTDTEIPTPTPCPAGTAGSACQLVCPTFEGEVCGGFGVCSEGRTGSGHCLCPADRCGLACEATLSNGVCPLSCVAPFACAANQECRWGLASAGIFCNDGNPDTFLDRCGVNGVCAGTSNTEPEAGTCRPCVPSDPGCYHPGVASQFWCDVTCLGSNSAACPSSHCRCGGPGQATDPLSQALACRPCKASDPGCTHAGVANQDWCSWNCYAGFFYYGSCTASHCHCPAGELPTCTVTEIASGSGSGSVSGSGLADRAEFCEDNCPAGTFNDADCSPDQCTCAAGYEGVSVVLRFNLPPALEAILAALCSANPEWNCNVDAVTSGSSSAARRKMRAQDSSNSWTVRVKVEDPEGGTSDLSSAISAAIRANAALLREQGMSNDPSVDVFGPKTGAEPTTPAAPTTPAPTKQKKEKHDTGKIVGIAVGVSVLVVLIALVGVVLCRRQRKKRAVARAGSLGTPYGASFRKSGVAMPSSSQTGVVRGSPTTFSPTTTNSRGNRARAGRAPQSPGAIAPTSTPVSSMPPRSTSQRFDYV